MDEDPHQLLQGAPVSRYVCRDSFAYLSRLDDCVFSLNGNAHRRNFVTLAGNKEFVECIRLSSGKYVAVSDIVNNPFIVTEWVRDRCRRISSLFYYRVETNSVTIKADMLKRICTCILPVKQGQQAIQSLFSAYTSTDPVELNVVMDRLRDYPVVCEKIAESVVLAKTLKRYTDCMYAPHMCSTWDSLWPMLEKRISTAKTVSDVFDTFAALCFRSMRYGSKAFKQEPSTLVTSRQSAMKLLAHMRKKRKVVSFNKYQSHVLLPAAVPSAYTFAEKEFSICRIDILHDALTSILKHPGIWIGQAAPIGEYYFSITGATLYLWPNTDKPWVVFNGVQTYNLMDWVRVARLIHHFKFVYFYKTAEKRTHCAILLDYIEKEYPGPRQVPDP